MKEQLPKLPRKTQLKPLTAASFALLAACSPTERLSKALTDSATEEVFEYSPEGHGNANLQKIFERGWSVQVKVLQSGKTERRTGSIAELEISHEYIGGMEGTLDTQGIIQYVLFSQSGSWGTSEIGQYTDEFGQVYIRGNDQEGKKKYLMVNQNFSDRLDSGTFTIDAAVFGDGDSGSVDLFLQDTPEVRFLTSSRRKVYSLTDTYEGKSPKRFRSQVNEIDYGISQAERDFNLHTVDRLVILDSYESESHAAYVATGSGATIFVGDTILMRDVSEADTGNFDHSIADLGYHEAVHVASIELKLAENPYLQKIYSDLTDEFFGVISYRGDHPGENIEEGIATFLSQLENLIIQERIARAPEHIQKQYAVFGAAIGRTIRLRCAEHEDTPEVVKKIFFATEPYAHLIQ